MKQSTLKEGDAVLVEPAIIHETVNAQSMLKEGDVVLVKPAIIRETVNAQGRWCGACQTCNHT